MASIAFSVSGSVNAGSTATVSWNSDGISATKYINSTGVNAYPRVNPKAQSVGTGTNVFGSYLGSFTATFPEPVTTAGVAVANVSVNYTLRTGSTSGTVLATSNAVTVYRTPTAPTSLTKQSATTSSITMRVSGGSFGNLQIKQGSGSYQNADSNGDVTFTGLSASTSYSFTARRLNGTNASTTITVTTSTNAQAAAPQPPTVTANKGVIPNGFNLTTTTSGSTNGTITYRWTTSARGGHDTGYVSQSFLGVGVEWVGSTWTVQAKASVSGQSDVFSNTSSVTLPTFSISGPSSMTEGTSGSFSNSVTNSASSTLYWQVTPTADFSTSSGSVSPGGSVSVTAISDGVTEATENCTFSLYINNTFNASNLVATKAFNVTDPAPTISTPSAPTATYTLPGPSSAAVTIVTQLPNGDTSFGGSLQFGQSTTNSPPSNWNTGSFASFTHPRGATRYYWARRSANNVSSSTSVAVPYLYDFDSSVTITPSAREVSDGDAFTTFTITNPSGSNTEFANSVYRLVTSSINPGWRASKAGEADGTAIITLYQVEGDLPPEGTAATYTYQLSGKRTTQAGGPPNNDSEFTNISGQSVTVERVVSDESISPSAMNEGASQSFTTANNKLSNLQNSTTYYWKVFSPGNADFSTTQGSFTTDSSGDTSGFTLTTVSDQVTENAETATIRIYTNESHRNSDDGTGSNHAATANFTINDTSTASSGGQQGDGGGGTATYGLIVKNANGTANIISSSQRVGGLIEYASIGTSIANASSLTLTGLPEITAANTNSVHFFISSDLSVTSQGTISYSNRGSNTNGGFITINNYSGATLDSDTKYYILRV